MSLHKLFQHIKEEGSRTDFVSNAFFKTASPNEKQNKTFEKCMQSFHHDKKPSSIKNSLFTSDDNVHLLEKSWLPTSAPESQSLVQASKKDKNNYL